MLFIFVLNFNLFQIAFKWRAMAIGFKPERCSSQQWSVTKSIHFKAYFLAELVPRYTFMIHRSIFYIKSGENFILWT